MRTRGIVAVGLALAIGCALSCTLACGSAEGACQLDELTACTCDDGSRGFAPCRDDESGLGECGSCGRIPGLDAPVPGEAEGGGGAGGGPGGGPGGATGGGTGELLPLYASCGADDECESGLCFDYTAKGPHCTHPCASNAECAAPSPQCTPRGVCKLP